MIKFGLYPPKSSKKKSYHFKTQIQESLYSVQFDFCRSCFLVSFDDDIDNFTFERVRI
jgi:hypothetical protein